MDGEGPVPAPGAPQAIIGPRFSRGHGHRRGKALFRGGEVAQPVMRPGTAVQLPALFAQGVVVAGSESADRELFFGFGSGRLGQPLIVRQQVSDVPPGQDKPALDAPLLQVSADGSAATRVPAAARARACCPFCW